jgi:hypothetical protein
MNREAGDPEGNGEGDLAPPSVRRTPAEPSASPLGPLVLGDVEDAREQWEAIVARVSLEQAAQLEADRAYHRNQGWPAAYGAAFAVLGIDTVEKIRTAVPPAADVPAAGTATITQAEGEEWDPVWFGSAAILTEGVQAEVAALKRVIMKLFLGRLPHSQHSWGRS